ncbi:hypothetical protein B0H14DRAFT_3424010 [Mycena olivaceomarginata]|nr:hypothetical protein B0H14DRAFT_3424010 [Mycena olivaceomarginata]
MHHFVVVQAGGGLDYNYRLCDGDGDGQLTEHGESALTPEDEDKAQLAVFETLDAALKACPLTVDEVQAGQYPGFAGIKRLEGKYRRAHPLVSAVGDARVWEEGDDD